METQTLSEYVEQEIAEIFTRVAEKVGNGELIDSASMSEDESAGIPMTIFHAHIALKNAWRDYVLGLSKFD